MATRIFRLTGVLLAGAANQALTGSPLTPPSGIKWTIVELRPALSDIGIIQGFFDTELYHTMHQEVTNQIASPRVVALDVVQPHVYRVLATDLSAAGLDAEVEVTVEESPLAGA